MEIVQAPNTILSQVAKPVGKIDENILSLVEEMKIALINQHDPEGVGLAAPQVGKSLQLFIIKEDKEKPFEIFINPVLEVLEEPKEEKPKKKKKNKLEGCLSLKDIWGTVKRSPRVRLTFLDENGEKQSKIFSGFFATILQHEYDHLQGILFPMRVLEQKGKLYKLKKDENDEEYFEPLKL